MEKNKDLISIIIPVYNVEKYLSDCLNGLINQTYNNLEIICVNDGSKDNSLNILNEFAQKDCRIKIINQENKGAGNARNTGLEIATGEYLYFLDSDDYIDKTLIEKAHNRISKFNAEICIFKNNEFEDESKKIKKNKSIKNNFKNIFNKNSYKSNFFSLFNIPAFTKLYKTEFIQKNNIKFQEIRTCNDVFFNFITLSLAERITFLNETLVTYRTNQKSNISSHRAKYIENVKIAFDLLKEELEKRQLFEILKETYYKKASECFCYEIKKLKKIEEKKKWIKTLLNNIPYKHWSFKTKKLVLKTKLNYHIRIQYEYKEEEIISFRKILGIKIRIKKLKASKEECLKHWYYEKTGEELNLKNPKTYNEKIQWLKLYDSTPIKTQLADKYLVREYIKEQIGEEYLIPLLGVWNNFDEINFNDLPNQFVLKCNHGSGYNLIVKDKKKFNKLKAKLQINKWLKEDFGYRNGYELHYSNIERKIIAEEYLSEVENNLIDYRFFCINGKVEQIWIDILSGTMSHKRKIYNKDWEELNIVVKWPRLEDNINKPTNLKEMIELSETLSKDFKFVRVDFYNINNKIYFGEMTFTSMSGVGKFEPEIEDYNLGKNIICFKQ